MQHGKGRCEWADGAIYNGDWKEGKKSGKGKYAAGKARYDGEWVDDKYQGQGVYLEENGDRYIGSFSKGERHGFGRCLYGDGTKYEGEWKEGKRWGQGTCIYSDGDVYSGAWERDQRHGVGFCRFADGSKFNGRWEDDGWVQSGADPDLCEIEGTGVTRGVAGKKATFKILARDEDGNQRLSGGDEFQVLLVHYPKIVMEEAVVAHGSSDNKPSLNTAKGPSNQYQSSTVEEMNSSIHGNDDLTQESENTRVGADEGALVEAPENVMPDMSAVMVTGDVLDCDDGTYEVSYVATTSGIYELRITVGTSVGNYIYSSHDFYDFNIHHINAVELFEMSPYTLHHHYKCNPIKCFTYNYFLQVLLNMLLTHLTLSASSQLTLTLERLQSKALVAQ